MKKLIVMVFVVYICSLSLNTYAVDTTGKIVEVTPTKWNVFLFKVSGKSAPVGCDTNVMYAIPSNTDWGKTAISSILMAMAAGNTVKASGENTCNYWGNTEDVQLITVYK